MPDYFRPDTLDEALAIRAERAGHGAGRRHRRLSGKDGARRLGRHAPCRHARHQRDRRACAASTQTETHIRFGALTTWTDLRRADAAAGFRRLSGGGARDRRRAGAEPRHAGRQHLHRLAGRRRHSLPADARRGESSSPRRPDGAACRSQTSSTATGTRSAGRDEIVTAILVPQAEGAARADSS